MDQYHKTMARGTRINNFKNNPQLQDPFARDVVADKSARFTLNNNHDNTLQHFERWFNIKRKKANLLSLWG